MNNDSVDQKRDQQYSVETPSPKNDDSKASMQFINGLLEGLTDDILLEKIKRESLTGRADHKTVKAEAAVHLKKWLHQLDHHANGIERPPGYRLVEVISCFCRKHTMETVIKPMHTEFFFEYCAALQEGQYIRAAILKVQMHYALVAAVVKMPLSRLLEWICGSITSKLGK